MISALSSIGRRSAARVTAIIACSRLARRSGAPVGRLARRAAAIGSGVAAAAGVAPPTDLLSLAPPRQARVGVDRDVAGDLARLKGLQRAAGAGLHIGDPQVEAARSGCDRQ